VESPSAKYGLKWLLKGLRYIAEKVAQVVTKHAKWSLDRLRLVETCTLRAAFSMWVGDREFNLTRERVV